MAKTWVLVANSSEAKLFSRENPNNGLDLLKDFTHPESREKGTDLASDRAGHYESTGHGSFVEQTSPKEYEAGRFARELAGELDAGRTGNRYERLILVAPSKFIGELNKCMNDHVRDMVITNIQKDYTKLAQKDLASAVNQHTLL